MEKHVDRPQPAFLKLRAWRRGGWMPARIYRPVPLDPDTWELLDRWPPLQADLGDRRGITEFWHICEIWDHSVIIDETEYREVVKCWPEVKRSKPANVPWNNPEGINAN